MDQTKPMKEPGSLLKRAFPDCPDPSLLHAAGVGVLPPAIHNEVAQHIKQCAACTALVGDLEKLDLQRLDAGTETRIKRRILIGGVPPELHPAFARVHNQSWIANIRQVSSGWWKPMIVVGAIGCVLLMTILRPLARQIPGPELSTNRITHPGVAQRSGERLVFQDGNETLSISSTGQITGLEKLPEKYRAILERVLVAKRIEPSSATGGLTSKSSVLLGSSGKSPGVTLIDPVGKIVEQRRPVFHWRATSPGEYQVSIYDQQYNLVAQSAWLRGTSWQLSAVLTRGARYSWQLSLRNDGTEIKIPIPPSPEARFRILGSAEETELNTLRLSRKDSHLVLGVAYAEVGLFDEAVVELGKLRDENPDSETIGALLASVERLREGSSAH